MKTPPAVNETARPVFMDIDAVAAQTLISKPQLYVLVRSGDFPPPVQLSTRRVAWKVADVQAWIDSREYVERVSITAKWTAPQAQPAAV